MLQVHNAGTYDFDHVVKPSYFFKVFRDLHISCAGVCDVASDIPSAHNCIAELSIVHLQHDPIYSSQANGLTKTRE